MKNLAVTILVLAACFAANAGELSLNDCKPIGVDYRVGPYLAVAGELQQLGQDKALEKLRGWAKDGKNEDQVIILTRMLFEKKVRGEFRRPMIGGAVFFGGTAYEQWPLEPIALHQGIPILITRGYMLGGVPESSAGYLDYCLKNCSWRLVKYAEKDADSLKKIIADFIKTTNWKQPLLADDELFLRQQAESPR